MTSIGCTAAIPAPSEGTNLTLYVAAKDLATNTGTNSYTGFNYDNTAPVITITIQTPIRRKAKQLRPQPTRAL